MLADVLYIRKLLSRFIPSAIATKRSSFDAFDSIIVAGFTLKKVDKIE